MVVVLPFRGWSVPLMRAFQSRWIDVEVDRMRLGGEQSSDEDDSSDMEQLVFDI